MFLNFEMFEFEKYKSSFKLFEKDNFTKYKDDIELVFIELPKFHKSQDECSTVEDRWLHFIKHANDIRVIPKNTDSNLEKAYKMANRASLTKEEAELQGKREEFLFIQKNSIEKAREEGIEQGREEEKKSMAKILKRAGVELSIIASTTSLSLEEIEKI